MADENPAEISSTNRESEASGPMLLFAHMRHNFADAFLPRLSEWTAASVTFVLGWMLNANPDRMYTGTGQGYRLLLSIAEQPTWSKILMVLGILRILVLLINGAWRRSPWARAMAAVLTCLFWTQIVLSFAPTFGFAFIFACGFLAMDLINIFRAMRDARTVDEAYKGRRPNVPAEH